MAQARIGGQVFDLVANGVLDVGDDEDANAKRVIEGGDDRVVVRRIPTTTNGRFMGNGNVNIAPLGTTGSAGDYFRSAIIRVDDVSTTGDAGVFLSQVGDAIFASGQAGSAVTSTTAQSLTLGTAQTFAANTVADRFVSIEYTPAGLPKTWHTTEIVSQAAVANSTTMNIVLRTAPPDGGSAISNWIIHGPETVALMEPGASGGIYEVRRNFKSTKGGFVLWTQPRAKTVESYGTFSG